MGLRRYILFSIIFIIAVGAYVYSFNGDTYTLTFFGVPVSLKIALWIILPVAILFLASVLHMMFYSLKNYMTQRNLQKDYNSYLQYVKQYMLGNDPDVKFSTSWFDIPSKVLKCFRFDPSKNIDNLEDEELKEIAETLKKIEEGESVTLKKFKLPEDNYFYRKNILNKLLSDKKESENILRKCEDKSDDICKMAFKIFCEYASYEDIKRQEFDIDKELFLKLLKRFENKEDSFEFSVDDLKELFGKFEFDKKEYIVFAKQIKTILNPDATLSIFEKISSEKEAALEAYLYLLFEFQMIDKIREVLQTINVKDCQKIRYILELKDCGKNFDVDIFFDV